MSAGKAGKALRDGAEGAPGAQLHAPQFEGLKPHLAGSNGFHPNGPGPNRPHSDGSSVAAPRRNIDAETWKRLEGNVVEILEALGLDLTTPETERTPERFLRAMFDATSGYDGDPKLVARFPAEHHGRVGAEFSQVVEGPITFYALCEHHALPFFGKAYVGYVADEHLLGLSKLTRLVRLYAKRFTVQERLGRQIADALTELVDAKGVAVYIEATHMCTLMRGVAGQNTGTRTTFWRGSYGQESSMRTEFLEMCRQRSGPGV